MPEAEALYIELLAGVKNLLRADTKLVGITRAALGWASACKRTWGCPARRA